MTRVFLLAGLLAACAGCSGVPPVPGLLGDSPAMTRVKAMVAKARKDPSEAAGWLGAGEAFEKLGLDDEAVKVYEEGLAAVPDRRALVERAAAAADRTDSPARVVRWLSEMLDQDGDDVELALRLAVAQARAGEADEARRRILDLVGSGRCPPARGQLARGWVELHAGNPGQARALARMAEVGGAGGTAHLLAVVMVAEERLDEAARLLRSIAGESSGHWEHRLLLGKVLLMGGATEEACEELKKVIELRSHHLGALMWTGLALAMADEPARARTVFERAARIGVPAAHLPLGILKPGDARMRRLARMHLRAYLQAFPDSPPGHPARRRLEPREPR